MKRSLILSFTILMVMFAFSCNAQDNSKKNVKTSVSDKVEVYYFHLTARCVTCQTVESEAKADIQALYGGKVSFQSINLDDASSKEIAEKLKVPGQALLIVKGKQVQNITNEGFMYARKDPAKFKSVIKEKIDALLK
ncbi:MAG: hypothetical protein A2X18_02875 [Bacteroidetes bacterium GWF2_40_14]|nr:MAG: hypothetical protein A2X18_02875 [Bacteroidetes bacterium GWF2_40_14]